MMLKTIPCVYLPFLYPLMKCIFMPFAQPLIGFFVFFFSPHWVL